MKIVNVASVPQRSPFRYPGGKTWLVPIIRKWFRQLLNKPQLFVEPFLGGGIISLTVAFESLAKHVEAAELDQEVAAVWHTLLSQDASWLAERIIHFDLTLKNAEDILATNPICTREQAFRTIVRNRTLHGGILASGSSFVKHGENGKGIRSRWYPHTLKKRIMDIADHISTAKLLSFTEGDGFALLEKHLRNSQAVFFLDPPYTAAGKKAGKRLYRHNELDHERLFTLASKTKGDFLMTYDAAQGVQILAEKHGFDTELVSMKNTHHATMSELLIGRDLSWIRKRVEQPQLFDLES